jgi:hypothetical protein
LLLQVVGLSHAEVQNYVDKLSRITRHTTGRTRDTRSVSLLYAAISHLYPEQLAKLDWQSVTLDSLKNVADFFDCSLDRANSRKGVETRPGHRRRRVDSEKVFELRMLFGALLDLQEAPQNGDCHLVVQVATSGKDGFAHLLLKADWRGIPVSAAPVHTSMLSCAVC